MSPSPASRAAATPQPKVGDAPTVRVTYRKSAIGYAHDQKATIAALGLHRLHQTVEHADTPALRGMVMKVRHLVSLDGVPADSPEVAARMAAERSTAAAEATGRREA